MRIRSAGASISLVLAVFDLEQTTENEGDYGGSCAQHRAHLGRVLKRRSREGLARQKQGHGDGEFDDLDGDDFEGDELDE